MDHGAVTSQRAWLFGPVADFALGCGGLYLAGWFALSTFAGDLLRHPPAIWLPGLILAFSIPHYGATLLRVYERRESRRTYAFVAVWVSLALLAAFVLSLHSFLLACWMVTLYLTWSPWHYTGQNFGIAVMFLRRQGVDVAGATRRLLQASFALSFVLTILIIHARAGQMSDYQVDAAFTEGIRFIPIGIPAPLADAAIFVTATGWAATTLAAIALLGRSAALRVLIPTLAIVLLQSLWFTIPYGLGYLRVETGLPVVDLGTRQGFFTYIAIAHAIQYLWITTYYARASTDWSGYRRYWSKALLLGQTIAVLPILLVATTGFGAISYDGGLLLLVVAFVNLHHFVLDGAIWKLRGQRIARVLVGAGRDDSPVDASGRPGRLAWTLAGVVFAVGTWTLIDRYHVFVPSLGRGDTSGAQSALDRLAWFGHDGGADRLRLAMLYADHGSLAEAEREVRHSIALRPLPEGFGVLGRLRSDAGDWPGARAAFERGLALAPEDPRLQRGAGVAAFRLGDWSAAEMHLRSAVAKGRNDPDTAAMLRDARDRLRVPHG